LRDEVRRPVCGKGWPPPEPAARALGARSVPLPYGKPRHSCAQATPDHRRSRSPNPSDHRQSGKQQGEVTTGTPSPTGSSLSQLSRCRSLDEVGAGLRSGRLTSRQRCSGLPATGWQLAPEGRWSCYRSHGGDTGRRHCHPVERQLLSVSPPLYIPICCDTLGGLAHGSGLIRVRLPTLEGTQPSGETQPR